MSKLDSTYTPPRNDLSGRVFGRLTIGHYLGGGRWAARCECGALVSAPTRGLTRGTKSSCGCLKAEFYARKARELTTHGKRYSMEWDAWASMWRRCTMPSQHGYEAYRARTPPSEWRDFQVFLREVGYAPSSDHTLERIRNDEPYGPGNCRWATRDEQMQNRSNTIRVAHLGRVVSLAKACKALGLKYETIRVRYRSGQSLEEASNGKLQPA